MKTAIVALFAGVALAGASAACGTSQSGPEPSSAVPVAEDAAASAPRYFTVGDIDPDEPAKKIERFQPLADFLAGKLGDFGIDQGRVVIARDIDELAKLFKDGEIDLYMDSAFPTLAVKEKVDSIVILRRWKNEALEYHSLFVSLRNRGVAGPEDLVGKVVAFEEPHSTSGFVLPAGSLASTGYILREVDSPDADVGPDEIGYVFSRDEENTIEFVLAGMVAAGGISDIDLEELPPEISERLIAWNQTLSVPRQLVSVRPGLQSEFIDAIKELMIGLEATPEGRALMDGLKSTKRFDPLPGESLESLRQLREYMKLVAGAE